GTISAGFTGIAAVASVFAGGITNSGKIIAGARGIGLGFAPTNLGHIDGVTQFTGSISNSGTISAGVGIGIFESTVQGAIVDSGTILAGSNGIEVDSAGVVSGGIKIGAPGKIVAGGDIGIDVANTATFAGGISNEGMVSANLTGVLVS